jgi:type IV pilus assembly protein PilE
VSRARNSRYAGTTRVHLVGFTLIELMIVVAVVAVLVAIALPNYSDYITRGKIMDATAKLASNRVKFEQFFLDNRTYVGACAAPPLGVVASAAPEDDFTISCPTAPDASTYTIQAAGNASKGMAGFTYTINEQNQKTSSGPNGYSNANCWATRKDGSCG